MDILEEYQASNPLSNNTLDKIDALILQEEYLKTVEVPSFIFDLIRDAASSGKSQVWVGEELDYTNPNNLTALTVAKLRLLGYHIYGRTNYFSITWSLY